MISSWHEVTVSINGMQWDDARGKIFLLRTWCFSNLSSHGHLWKHFYNDSEWVKFYFATSEDAVMFRLTNGV